MNERERIANLEQQLQALRKEKREWLEEKQQILGDIEQGIVLHPTCLMLERQILNMNHQLHLLLQPFVDLMEQEVPTKEPTPAEEKPEKVVKKRRKK
jgi:hypothetical protein